MDDILELIIGLDLELLDDQINTLHQLEACELLNGPTPEQKVNISGLLNFLCPLYNELKENEEK